MPSYQVRFHGRGGQGVVTSAELLAAAAFAEGRQAQAFPSFGSERTGAPVESYCRLADGPIRTREPIAEPDAVVVGDPTVLAVVDCVRGLRPDGCLLINSARSPAELHAAGVAPGLAAGRLVTVNATDLALARVGRPVPNAALLGGFAACTGVVGLDSVVAAIEDRFSGTVAEGNVAAAVDAYQAVRAHLALEPAGPRP